jgi:protein phosphatase
MATMLTAAYLLWPRLYVVHAGDSRCYLCRSGQLYQLTEDHTMAQKLVARGLEVEDASHLHHMLWNALGGKSGTPSAPEVCRADLLERDAVLLCSDGLTKHVERTDIADVLSRGQSAERCCKELLAMANEAGGKDNITIVVARCNPPNPEEK